MVATASDRIWQKYKWAEDKVRHFEEAADKFRIEQSFGTESRVDESAGTRTFYVSSIPEVPVHLSLLLGDAIHNLRSVLDHLAYALVVAAGENPKNRTCFPIFDSLTKYQDGVDECAPGVSKLCRMELDNVAPYKGGWGNWAWRLHQLDIRDKHRFLLTVAAVNVARTMTKIEEERLGVKNYPHVTSPTDLKPVALGYELATFPKAEADDGMRFAFDVALDEEGVESCFPTFLLLRHFTGEVFRTIQRFEIYLIPRISTSPANHP